MVGVGAIPIGLPNQFGHFHALVAPVETAEPETWLTRILPIAGRAQADRQGDLEVSHRLDGHELEYSFHEFTETDPYYVLQCHIRGGNLPIGVSIEVALAHRCPHWRAGK